MESDKKRLAAVAGRMRAGFFVFGVLADQLDARCVDVLAFLASDQQDDASATNQNKANGHAQVKVVCDIGQCYKNGTCPTERPGLLGVVELVFRSHWSSSQYRVIFSMVTPCGHNSFRTKAQKKTSLPTGTGLSSCINKKTYARHTGIDGEGGEMWRGEIVRAIPTARFYSKRKEWPEHANPEHSPSSPRHPSNAYFILQAGGRTFPLFLSL